MFLSELPLGHPITLIATIGNDKIEFETTVQETYPQKHLILAEPIIKNEKVVTFHAKKLIINILTTPPDSAPLLFKNVTVNLMRKPDDTLCYSITCLTEGKMNNRRESFRCYVGINSSMQCGGNRAAHDAVIKDVSANGFSVTCNADVEFKEGQVIHVLLKDYLEELAENFSFHLYGIIVRKQELENEKLIYGCRLNNKVIGLETYIAKKERLRLKKTHGGST